MVIKSNIKKAEDVGKFISDEMNSGAIVHGSGVSLRATWAKVLETVYGGDWGKVEIASIVPEELGDEFERRMADRYKRETIRIAKSRIKRIFRLIERDEEAERGKETKSKNYDPDLVRRLIQSMQAMQNVFLPKLSKEVFKADGKEKYDYFCIPVSTDKVAGLALPKNLTMEELEAVRNLMTGVFVCEEAKKKGEV